MMKAKSAFLAILLVAIWASVVLSQPTIQGRLSGNLGPGAYVVIGNCSVDAGATLTVAPGTTFQFSGHFSIKVYGTLNAVGTAADSILFVRQSVTPDCEWSGLRFMAGAPANSVVSYALFEGARYQVWPDYYGGALFIGAPVTISHCYVNNCYSASGGGIYIASVNSGTVNITDCIIMNCSAGNGGGLYVYYSNATVNILNSFIARNSSTST
jgi:hypothetical protein